MKRLFAVALVAGLAACSTPAPAPETLVTEACNVYGRSLSVLAAARAQGRLTPDQVATIQSTIPIAVPLCSAATPPAGAATVLGSLNSTLESLIFTTQAPR